MEDGQQADVVARRGSGEGEHERTCPREGGEKIKQMDGGKPTKAEVVLEDADLVLPGLYLGSYKATEDKAKLQQQGITHILIAAANIQPKFPKDFAYLVLHEVLDTEEQDIMSHFADCLEFIHQARNQDGCVLVVCMAGMSRSASVVTAYVMDEYQLCAEEAYCIVKRARSKVCPNPSFVQQLRLFHILRDEFIDARVTPSASGEEGEAKEAEDTRTGQNERASKWPVIDDTQRERAQRDYAMVRHISHMYHAAHKLSREGRIPLECFAKDPTALQDTDERMYHCSACNRRLFSQSSVLPHKKKRPTIACNVVFIQPLDWMLAKPPQQNAKDDEIPAVGEDQEEGNHQDHAKDIQVRYISSFHPRRNGETLEFINKDRLGNLHKVFGELRCPECDNKVGYWNWMGNGCYCGQRMMPAFCIERKTISSSCHTESNDFQNGTTETERSLGPCLADKNSS